MALRRMLPAHSERTSRAGFLQRTALVGGGLAAGGIVAGGLSQHAASALSPAQDVRVLNLVLELEYLEVAFYEDAVARGAIAGELLEFATIVGGHERQHVEFLRGTLGSQAVAQPRFQLGDATRDPQAFTQAAIALEDTMVAAYNGQATNLTPAALGAAARIVSVEARHAAWIRDIAGETPAEHATDAPLTEREVRSTLARAGLRKRGGP